VWAGPSLRNSIKELYFTEGSARCKGRSDTRKEGPGGQGD
jgi:hypothetical protein